VVRRRPSQPTRRGLAHKRDLYRLPREATHPRGEHPDPGSTCSPTQRHWQASASTSAARVPYGTRATVPNRHRGTRCHGDPSAASPEGNASFRDRRPPPRGDGRWRHASLEASHRGSCCSPLPVRSLPVSRTDCSGGCSAAHPAHNAGRARRASSPFSTAGAVEASVTRALLADCTRRG